MSFEIVEIFTHILSIPLACLFGRFYSHLFQQQQKKHCMYSSRSCGVLWQSFLFLLFTWNCWITEIDNAKIQKCSADSEEEIFREKEDKRRSLYYIEGLFQSIFDCIFRMRNSEHPLHPDKILMKKSENMRTVSMWMHFKNDRPFTTRVHLNFPNLLVKDKDCNNFNNWWRTRLRNCHQIIRYLQIWGCS